MTEQEKYGIEQLSEYLEMQIRIKDGRIKRYKEQMDSDFLYYFAWAGKDLFKEHYMVGKYKELRRFSRRRRVPKPCRIIFRENAGNASKNWLTAKFIPIIRKISSIWHILIRRNAASSSSGITTGSGNFSR